MTLLASERFIVNGTPSFHEGLTDQPIKSVQPLPSVASSRVSAPSSVSPSGPHPGFCTRVNRGRTLPECRVGEAGGG